MTIDSLRDEGGDIQPMVFSKYKYHPARITIKHWQLRDLICSPGSSNEVIYPCNNEIHSLDLASSKNTVISEFDFEPRCIRANSTFIAAGGLRDSRAGGSSQKGLFAILNRHTGQYAAGEVGDQINNAVVLYGDDENEQQQQQMKAVVCNNDSSLYFVNIADYGFVPMNSMKLTSPLNYATVSPDNKTIIACGDTSQVMVINSEDSSGSNWKLNKSFHSGSDLGFSAAFHSSGMTFGVAFQDGMARLYDIRKLSQPLTQIKSTRPTELMGAFRCLKFSSGPEDLLLLSEQMDRIHVVDLRNYDNHQVLTVPSVLSNSPESEENIATVESYRKVVEHPSSPRPSRRTELHLRMDHQVGHPVHRGVPRSYHTVQGDNGISGICWSECNGGSIVVGYDSGIGVWKVDGWIRRTFPSFAFR